MHAQIGISYSILELRNSLLFMTILYIYYTNTYYSLYTTIVNSMHI